MKGGIFAKYFVTVPSEHYYQTDPARDHDAVRTLLARGVTTFYLGHGGPVARDDVAAWVADADESHAPHAATIELAGQLDRGTGSDGAGGLVRVRYGVGRPLGYLGGLDVAAGSLGGAYASLDVHALGVAVRGRAGAFAAVTAGGGVGGVRGISASHAFVELSGELPVGPVRLLARAAGGWRLGGVRYSASSLPVDELTALAGVRLGRDRPWGRVVAGRGPYLAGTYQRFGGASWLGAVLGFELAAGD